MPAYQVLIDTINARLKRAKETLKGLSAGPMRKDYEAEIKRLEDRLRKEKTKRTTKTSKAELDYASEKARKAAAETKRKAAAAKKAKLNKAAAVKSETPVHETTKQKKVAKAASFDKQEKGAFKPKSPKAKSRDTLGVAAKEAKDAREKREADKRKKQAYTVDPSSYKINPMESPRGYTKEEERAGITTALKDAEKGTSGRFGTKAGRRAIKKFFKDAFDADITVDYKFPGDEGYGSPEGGKMNGGKVISKKHAGGQLQPPGPPSRKRPIRGPRRGGPMGPPGVRPRGPRAGLQAGPPGVRPGGPPGVRPRGLQAGPPGVRPRGPRAGPRVGPPGVRPRGPRGVRPGGPPGVRPGGPPGVRPMGPRRGQDRSMLTRPAGNRKSGGKVPAKKYAMNRGGMASVRKPTRA